MISTAWTGECRKCALIAAAATMVVLAGLPATAAQPVEVQPVPTTAGASEDPVAVELAARRAEADR